ncbi:hypothetical protein BGZ49_004631 [Haplosporangium sp. Z 27]|nr:hypothetical protein BGZ49_004631 [Haplosporangium sp. Z 27]
MSKMNPETIPKVVGAAEEVLGGVESAESEALINEAGANEAGMNGYDYSFGDNNAVQLNPNNPDFSFGADAGKVDETANMDNVLDYPERPERED